MSGKKKFEPWPVGIARHILLNTLKATEKDWECKEIVPSKRNGYVRKITFTKNEAWKYEDQ